MELIGLEWKRLHRMCIYTGVKLVFSPEQVSKDAVIATEGEQNKKSTVGTSSFMPPAFDCFLASIVINDLID